MSQSKTKSIWNDEKSFEILLNKKEFDELQEKKIQMNEQFRTIVGPQQVAAMSIGSNQMAFQTGRQQR